MRFRHRPTPRWRLRSRWRPRSQVDGPPRSSPIHWRVRSPAPRAPPSRLESARMDALPACARRSSTPRAGESPHERGVARSLLSEGGGGAAVGAPLTQAVEQIGRRIAEEQQRRVLEAHEALFDGVAEQPPEPVPVAVHVQHTYGLGVNAQLCPGQDLERLIEGSETPGKRDEPVSERRPRGPTPEPD